MSVSQLFQLTSLHVRPKQQTPLLLSQDSIFFLFNYIFFFTVPRFLAHPERTRLFSFTGFWFWNDLLLQVIFLYICWVDFGAVFLMVFVGIFVFSFVILVGAGDGVVLVSTRSCCSCCFNYGFPFFIFMGLYVEILMVLYMFKDFFGSIVVTISQFVSLHIWITL